MKTIINKFVAFAIFCQMLAFSYILPSCTGGGPDEVGIIYEIDSISTEYCIFSKGDMWIYKLQGSSIVDTLVLTQSEFHTTQPGNELSSDGFEQWQYKYESINRIESILKGSGVVWPLVSTFIPTVSRAIIYPPGGGGFSFVSIFFGSDSIGLNLSKSGGGNIELIESYDSFEVEEIKYPDVLVFNNMDLFWSTVQTKLYWAPKVGRIRVETQNGEVWNLLKYIPK